MSWNYRVVHETEAVPGPDETEIEDIYTIREVFYDDDHKPELWSAEPCSPQGDNLASLREDLGHMLMALEQDVLEESELPHAE